MTSNTEHDVATTDRDAWISIVGLPGAFYFRNGELIFMREQIVSRQVLGIKCAKWRMAGMLWSIG